MTSAPEPATPSAPDLRVLCQAVGEDLLLLALLHDRELTAQTLDALRQDGVGDLLGLRLASPAAREALDLLRQGLSDIPHPPDAQTLDILAAEYADIYLNHTFEASPCESVWLDEDGLIMQEPMFQIRAWYQRYGLTVANWRLRTDDHLVSQLQFLAFLLQGDASTPRLEEIARFLDEHLLRWIGAFASRIAARSRTRFYAGLASLTAAYLEEFRDLAADLLACPRPSAAEIEERLRPPREVLGQAVKGPLPYRPSEGPGW